MARRTSTAFSNRSTPSSRLPLNPSYTRGCVMRVVGEPQVVVKGSTRRKCAVPPRSKEGSTFLRKARGCDRGKACLGLRHSMTAPVLSGTFEGLACLEMSIANPAYLHNRGCVMRVVGEPQVVVRDVKGSGDRRGYYSASILRTKKARDQVACLGLRRSMTSPDYPRTSPRNFGDFVS